ncbi:hypothetical protein C8J56DRAFT_1164627 [Mycena floridula]|nr:hypothetical protein C8J56DRAFT_1164627 [Mycena floridula]
MSKRKHLLTRRSLVIGFQGRPPDTTMKRHSSPAQDPSSSPDIAQGPAAQQNTPSRAPKKQKTEPTPATSPSAHAAAAPGSPSMVRSSDEVPKDRDLGEADLSSALKLLLAAVNLQTAAIEGQTKMWTQHFDPRAQSRKSLPSSEPVAQLHKSCWTERQLPKTVFEDDQGTAELKRSSELSDAAEKAEQSEARQLWYYSLFG